MNKKELARMSFSKKNSGGFTSILFLLAIVALVGTAGYITFTKDDSAPTVSENTLAPVATTTEEITTPIFVDTPTTPVTPGSSATKLLQDCPETWFDNQMPMIIDPGQPRPVTQYFIYKGERRELAEFDMKWVSANCPVQPSAVY
ncbi:MAG: hypothetical protein M0P64_03365 [Candidatus Pacebacteria bacterium]|jgi:hypothetical protein|nr:hypothetical protein [Candidatus Paceibacterota bacterium]